MNMLLVVDALDEQLQHAGLGDLIKEVSHDESAATFQLVHNSNCISITVFKNMTAAICCVCKDGFRVSYPIASTPHNMFMNIGMAMEFSNNHKDKP